MFQQEQFLEVIDRDEAQRRFHVHLDLKPLGAEAVPLEQALGRVLAEDVTAPVDVPSFDRSNVDGFAVRAADTYGASQERPRRLRRNAESLSPGVEPQEEVEPGTTTAIATGAMLPRGSDAVVMVEYTDTPSTSSVSNSGDQEMGELEISRPVTPGANITYAGTDIARGETVLRRVTLLTSRETAVLAAVGVAEVPVYRRPRVAILSTGDEIIAPGQPMRPGLIYDSNAVILADAVRELGGSPVFLGIFPDDEAQLQKAVEQAVAESDLVLLSGGTSKGAGDLNYRVVQRLKPGIVVHGVALKPGKPLCLAVAEVTASDGSTTGVAGAKRSVPRTQPGHGLRALPPATPGQCETRRVPVVILPGFPTSAIFTFHEFVAPLIRIYSGQGGTAGPSSSAGAQPLALLGDPISAPSKVSRSAKTGTVPAVLPMRVNSERGRTEYLLVSLVERVEGGESASGYQGSRVRDQGSGATVIRGELQTRIPSPRPPIPDPRSRLPTRRPADAPRWVAYPMGKGSGSVTTFSRADGFITIPRNREYLEEGEVVEVQLLGQEVRPADLVVIGSHCVGLDLILGRLHEAGYTSKFLAVGSQGGLSAARRGECDVAGIHLLDPQTDIYNTPFVTDDLLWVPGYRRMQGIVFRPEDHRFEGRTAEQAVQAALNVPDCRMVNRNRGSGTRVLIDRLLGPARPAGYEVEPRSHQAVAAAVAQRRADWGVAIETVARQYDLGFLPLREEHYDFVVPRARSSREAVQAFCAILQTEPMRAALRELGFASHEQQGPSRGQKQQ